MRKLTETQVRAAILTAWRAGLVPNLIGPVGTGKTAVVKGIHAEIMEDRPDYKLWQFLSSTVQSVDVAGYPVPPTEGCKTVSYAAPSYLPYILGDAEKDAEAGILFCDELDRATIETLNALTQLFHGGQIHDFRLRKGVLIICAMNGETDIGTTMLPEAIKTRLVNIYVDDAIKPDWYEQHGWDIADLIPQLQRPVSKMLEQMGSLNKRTLEFSLRLIDAANVLSGSEEWEHDEEVVFACVAGLIGEVNAEKVITHRMIPTIKQILADPDGVNVPSHPSHRVELAQRVSTAHGASRSESTRQRLVNFGRRLGEETFASVSGATSFCNAMTSKPF